MLTDRQQKICEKYSARGEDGKVRCSECPLVIDNEYHMCKANCTYNPKTREWESNATEVLITWKWL